jgi:hypothetical protein
MRMFSIIGLIISLLIVGWLTASYMSTVTGTPAFPDSDSNPAGNSQPGELNMASPINKARQLASDDLERQKQMEQLIKK